MRTNKAQGKQELETDTETLGNKHRQYTFLVTNVVPLRMEKDRSIKILWRHGHVATLAVHYFSNNFNGLESHLKTLFRYFISRHLSCFSSEKLCVELIYAPHSKPSVAN